MPFATTFAFCFEMREGMLLLSGLQLFSAVFWAASITLSTEQADLPENVGLQWGTIAMLLTNACVGLAAVRAESETFAALQICTFGVQLVLLCTDFIGDNHPDDCANGTVNSSDSPLSAHCPPARPSAALPPTLCPSLRAAAVPHHAPMSTSGTTPLCNTASTRQLVAYRAHALTC